MEENKRLHGNSRYYNILTKKYLLKHYHTDGMTWICNKLKVDRTTVHRYLKKYNLKIIKLSEIGKQIRGKNG